MPTAAPQPKKRTGKGKNRNPPRHSYRPAGRPTKLTEELWNTFLEKIRSGLPFKYAALAAGTHPDSVERWRATVSGLEEELAQAQGQAVAAAWGRIEQAGAGYDKKPPDWRSDAWRLAELDKFQFQHWALSLIGAHRLASFVPQRTQIDANSAKVEHPLRRGRQGN